MTVRLNNADFKEYSIPAPSYEGWAYPSEDWDLKIDEMTEVYNNGKWNQAYTKTGTYSEHQRDSTYSWTVGDAGGTDSRLRFQDWAHSGRTLSDRTATMEVKVKFSALGKYRFGSGGSDNNRLQFEIYRGVGTNPPRWTASIYKDRICYVNSVGSRSRISDTTVNLSLDTWYVFRIVGCGTKISFYMKGGDQQHGLSTQLLGEKNDADIVNTGDSVYEIDIFNYATTPTITAADIDYYRVAKDKGKHPI